MGKIENYINCLASIKMDKLDNQIIEFDDYCILRLKQNPSSWVYLSEPEMKKEYEREVERRADNQEIFQKEEDDCCYTIKEKMQTMSGSELKMMKSYLEERKKLFHEQLQEAVFGKDDAGELANLAQVRATIAAQNMLRTTCKAK